MRIFKDGEESTKNICYILQFINSARFMAISFSHLVNILSEGIHKTKWKHEHADKKCETCEIKYIYTYIYIYIYIYCDCFLEHTNFKDDLIECKVYTVTRVNNTSLMKS